MPTKIRLLILVTLLAACGTALAETPLIIDTFDSGDAWRVEPASDPVSLFITSRFRLQGSKAMGIRLSPGAVRTATISRQLHQDFSGDSKLSVTVRSPHEGLAMALMVDAGGEEPTRYVSRPASLGTGWQRVDFPLNAELYYMNRSRGVRVRPANLDAVKSVGFVIYNPAGLKAEMYLDALAVTRLSEARPARPTAEKQPPEVVEAGETVEVGVRLDAAAGDVRVEGVFTSPSGKVRRVAGFTAADAAGWRLIRYLAGEPGDHSYYAVVSSGGGVVTTPVRRITARKPEQPAAASETGIIGLNVAWADDFSPYLRNVATGGGNTVRIWLSPWGLNLEESPGVYSPTVARRIDGIMSEAARLRVGVILTVCTSGELTAGGWENNPYNRTKGGPCLLAEEFLADGDAIALFEKKLRYCIRRWGAYASLRAVEPAGDLDRFPAPDNATRLKWLRRMCAAIEQENVFGCETILGLEQIPEKELAEGIGSIGRVDRVGVHFLPQGEDPVPFFVGAAGFSRIIGKPVFVEEYGGAWKSSGDTADPDGSALKAGLWVASAITGEVPMPWWWDSHIMGRKLFGVFRDVAMFTGPLDGKTYVGTRVESDLADGTKIAGRVYPNGAFLVAFRSDVLTCGENARKPVAGAVAVTGLMPGRYKVDLWDVAAGKTAGNSEATVGRNSLDIPVQFAGAPVVAVRVLPADPAQAKPGIGAAAPKKD
ncbi:MAG: hypothetical protein JW909_13460 [Planctomycetes bacterium]|nr:hypothetical protein [Planctomycetota bacterium]